MANRKSQVPVIGRVMPALFLGLLIAGVVLLLARAGNLDKLPVIAIAIGGALLPVAIALVAVFVSSKARSKSGA